MNDAKNKHLPQVCNPVIVQSPIEFVINWVEGKRKGGKTEHKILSAMFLENGW